jgi:hypothetical protein
MFSTLNTYDSVLLKASLLIDVIFLGLLILIWKTAFSAGSSKHGKALRASVGSKSVATSHLK